jgi:hypothetical protein
MMRALAVLAMSASPVLAGEAEDRLAPCLAEVQARFHAGSGSDAGQRFKGLGVLNAADARCLATVTATCLRRKERAEACFADLLAYASQRRAALLRDMPEALEDGPPGMPANFADWREIAMERLARPDLRGCRFDADAPPSACAALEAGSAWLEARDWARMILVVEEARK